MPTVSADADITFSYFRWTVLNAEPSVAIYSSLAIIFSGAPAARRAAKRSPIFIWERKEIHE